MKKRVIVFISLIFLASFIFLKVKYAFEMELLSLFVEVKAEQMIQQVKDAVNPEEPQEVQEGKDVLREEAGILQANARISNTALVENDDSAASATETTGTAESVAVIQEKSEERVEVVIETWIEEVSTQSEEEIAEAYGLRFKELSTSLLRDLTALIEQAKEEYIALSPDEREQNKTFLMQKYLGLGESLEKSADLAFDQMCTSLAQELENAGFSQNLSDIAKSSYVTEKKDLKKQLMQRFVN